MLFDTLHLFYLRSLIFALCRHIEIKHCILWCNFLIKNQRKVSTYQLFSIWASGGFPHCKDSQCIRVFSTSWPATRRIMGKNYQSVTVSSYKASSPRSPQSLAGIGSSLLAATLQGNLPTHPHLQGKIEKHYRNDMNKWLNDREWYLQFMNLFNEK